MLDMAGEKHKGRFCTIEATVVTGFEEVAKEEAEERFNTCCKVLRGRISFECPIESVEQVSDLGCVDNCRVIMTCIPDFKFTDNQIENLQRLRTLVGLVDWSSGLQVWRKFFTFEHEVVDRPLETFTDYGEVVMSVPTPAASGEKLSRTQKKKKRRKNKTGDKDKQQEKQSNDNKEELINLKAECTDSQNTDLNLDGMDIKVKTGPTSEKNVSENKVCKSETDTKECRPVESAETMQENGGCTAKKPRVRENPWNPNMPSFRVTCIRVGENHTFDSMTAASNFGGAIYRYFGWNVKMTEFDIEVFLCIEDKKVTVSIGLTRESLHRRNITHFGPTTLRPTIAHSMLRLCEIKPGDIVCDPMCGAGSIPIQGALNWPYSPQICGEIARRALDRYSGNVKDMNKARQKENKSPLLIDAVRWDVCKLPFKDHSVDVFITDLPFGVRMGHKVDNWKLYPGALIDMARVVKPESGRCCLLTEDKKCMTKTLQYLYKYWKRVKTLGVNIGGLTGGVYVLLRTAEPLDDAVNRNVFAPRGKKENVPSTMADSDSQSGDEK